MSDLPFIADARYPRGYPELDEGKWFQWRSVAMIELSALDTYQFVKSMLPHSAQTILEVDRYTRLSDPRRSYAGSTCCNTVRCASSRGEAGIANSFLSEALRSRHNHP